ncbi:MAG: carbohydrate binding domain-containing protein, partial [Flavobacteriales bacterium]
MKKILFYLFIMCSGSLFSQDTDNDGIANTIDLDDDNDGILDVDECFQEIISGEFKGTFGEGSGAIIRDLENPPGNGYEFNTTNYDEGGYAVINHYAQNWHIMNGWGRLRGHTTGTRGDAYLAVNGSTSVSTFYQQAVTLTQNTDYKISLWAASVSNDRPRVKIFIEDLSGNVIASFETIGLSPINVWHEASGVFNTNSQTNFILKVQNVTTTSTGNDFAIDDISFSALNCPDIDGDGIPNSEDLDSDGDGCFDVVEAGINPLYITNDTKNVIGPFGSNGLSNIIESDDTQNAFVNTSFYSKGFSTYNQYALDK